MGPALVLPLRGGLGARGAIFLIWSVLWPWPLMPQPLVRCPVGSQRFRRGLHTRPRTGMLTISLHVPIASRPFPRGSPHCNITVADAEVHHQLPFRFRTCVIPVSDHTPDVALFRQHGEPSPPHCKVRSSISGLARRTRFARGNNWATILLSQENPLRPPNKGVCGEHGATGMKAEALTARLLPSKLRLIKASTQAPWRLAP